MQTFKDAAALATLILLALTLRVDLHGQPIELDLDSPAEAAIASPSTPPKLTALPVAGPRLDTAPSCSDVRAVEAVQAPNLTPTGRGRVIERAERQKLVWQVGQQRFLILLGNGEETEVAEPAPSPAPTPCCADLAGAPLSC